MIEMMTPSGGTIRVSGLPFSRTLSMEGTRSSTEQQRRKVKAGNWVKLPSGVGPIDYAVIAVSTDKLTWRDENAVEHYTYQVLL
jgi:hypothetical protein